MRISKINLGVFGVLLLCGVASALAETDTPAQASARAALLKRIHDADTNQPPVVMINTVPSTPAMTPEQMKAMEDAAAQANARKEAEEKAKQQSADSAAQAKTAALRTSYPGKELGFAPPSSPPSPITPEKQARLDNLLIEYKMNQISPEAYHTQRAAILAQP